MCFERLQWSGVDGEIGEVDVNGTGRWNRDLCPQHVKVKEIAAGGRRRFVAAVRSGPDTPVPSELIF